MSDVNPMFPQPEDETATPNEHQEDDRRQAIKTARVLIRQVMEHVRQRGLGEWMLGQAVMAAWSTTPARVTVSTNTLDHPVALPLYQRLGFEPVSQNEAIIRPLSDQEILAVMKAEGPAAV